MSIINKKFDRFKQWTGEKMGGEVKTDTSDNFKAMEVEMQLRHAGMEKMQKSMLNYIRAVSERDRGDDKEKLLPQGRLGATMVKHGEDFEPDSEFGNCLNQFGKTQEKIARTTETYIAYANSTWLESVDRSMAQFKEYQSARKKLDQRRLAYDTSLSKVQKAKKEDFRMEEELRTQKAKYEEASEDVYRRMEDIKESEAESIQDLTAFMEAELEYYEKCRDMLVKLKREWPATAASPNGRKANRSNATAHSFADRYKEEEEEAPPPRRIPTIGSRSVSATNSNAASPYQDRERDDYFPPSRPSLSRTSTRDASPGSDNSRRITRVATDSQAVVNARSQLRTMRMPPPVDPYEEAYDGSNNASPVRGRSASPSTALGRELSGGGLGSRKAPPPPPPPSRAKKPPPPPPMKRSALSSSSSPYG